MPHLALPTGVNLFYFEAGRGDPVLLLPGLTNDYTVFAPQLGRLSQCCRAIAPDFRGTGQTRDDGRPFTLADLADDMVALLDALDLPSAHVVGLSLGGAVAQVLALRRPERVKSLALLATWARTTGHLAAVLASWQSARQHQGTEAFRHTAIPWVFSRRAFDAPGLIDAVVRRAAAYRFAQTAEDLARQVEAARPHDVLDRLPDFAVPTLVVAGSDDLLLPPASAREMASRIPQARYVEIPGGAHAFAGELPDPTNDLLVRWLKGQEV